MSAHIDENLCIGCRLCTSIEANVFQMNDGDKAEVIADTTPDTEQTVIEAIESCPTGAISQE